MKTETQEYKTVELLLIFVLIIQTKMNLNLAFNS